MKSKFVFLGLGVLIGLAMVGWQFLARPYTYQGSVIEPPQPAPDFQLTDQNGQPFRLSEQKGKAALIFFGYTNCPDVCPVTLSKFKQIRAQLGAQADQVEFIFITVDPARDTPQRLKEHLANFDPAIIGLTGSQAELEPVWKSYGVYVAKQDTGSAAGYEVSHSTLIYAVDKNGDLHLTYPFEMDSRAILDDLRHLIKTQ